MTQAPFLETRIAKFYLTEQPTNCPQVGDYCQHRDPDSLPRFTFGIINKPQGEFGQIIEIKDEVAYVLWMPDGFSFNAPYFRHLFSITELLKVERILK